MAPPEPQLLYTLLITLHLFTTPSQAGCESNKGKSCFCHNIDSLDELSAPCPIIHVTDSQITSITSHVLSSLLDCQVLTLKATNTKKIEENAFSNFTSLRQLNVINNNFTVIKIKGKLKELEELRLSGNQLDKLRDGDFPLLDRLKVFDVSYNEIEDIGDITCSFPSVEEIRLNNNKLTELSRLGSFGCNLRLVELDLSHNLITTLPATCLANLNSLKLLKMNDNRLKTIENGSFDALGELRDLNLENNLLDMTPAFKDLLNLQRLFLQNNSIQYQPGDFNGLAHLIQLNLQGGYSQASFNDLEGLEVLDLHKMKIHKLVDLAFNGMRSLRELDLSGNLIEQVGNLSFCGAPNLVKLDLSYNNIQVIAPKSFAGNKNLEVLILQRNILESLDSTSLYGLENLVQLDLSSSFAPSHIIEIGAFAGLGKLKVLNMSYNHYIHLREHTFDGLSQLENLILEGKVYEISSNAFRGLAELKSLNLSNLGLELKPNTFTGLMSLENLDLSRNKLTTIFSNCFSGLQTLNQLDLRDSGVKTIESNAFEGLLNLEYVELQGNCIENLPANCFTGLTNLKVLDLSSLGIKSVTPAAFSKLHNLETLKLGGNNLTKLSSNTFQGLSNLKTLLLNQSSITLIDSNAFADLSTLLNLDLNDNNIKLIRTNSFFGLTGIMHLEINHTKFGTIEEGGFNGLNNTKVVSFINVEIGSVGKATFGTSPILSIRLCNSTLRLLEFGSLSELRKLMTVYSCKEDPKVTNLYDFSNLGIREIQPGAFKDFGVKQNQSLSFNANKLKEIYNATFEGIISTINSLTLINNRIENVEPGAFTSLNSLDALELTGNLISTIHENVFSIFDSLNSLNLDQNCITSINPKAFANLTSLRILDLSENKITELDPELFRDLLNLETLNLQKNSLTTLHRNLFHNLYSLESFNISQNQLTALDTVILSHKKHLKDIDVSFNSLASINYTLLSHLNSINLNSNKWTCPTFKAMAKHFFQLGTHISNIDSNFNCKIDYFEFSESSSTDLIMNMLQSTDRKIDSMVDAETAIMDRIVVLEVAVYILLTIVVVFVTINVMKRWFGVNDRRRLSQIELIHLM